MVPAVQVRPLLRHDPGHSGRRWHLRRLPDLAPHLRAPQPGHAEVEGCQQGAWHPQPRL